MKIEKGKVFMHVTEGIDIAGTLESAIAAEQRRAVVKPHSAKGKKIRKRLEAEDRQRARDARGDAAQLKLLTHRGQAGGKEGQRLVTKIMEAGKQ